MKRVFLPRHFLASVVLLLVLVSIYAFSEGQRVRSELLRQTEAKGRALADALETSAKNAILGNTLLEEQISQRLLDNARLVDQLLISGDVDQDLLKQISLMNHLQKVELLDNRGQRWEPPPRPTTPMEMMEMKKRIHSQRGEEAPPPHPPFRPFMWGRHWAPPLQKQGTPEDLPPQLKERRFWEGSMFGVAVGARAFPGVIVVHANADYILNFKNEIGVQRQIEELGQQSDIDYVALLDSSLKFVAHTDRGLVDQKETDPSILKVGADGQELSRIVELEAGKREYQILKPMRMNGSALGFLKIGLSLDPVDIAWRNSLSSMAVLGLAILTVGIFGMAVIFYNQYSHTQQVKNLEAEVAQRDRLSALGNMAATVAHEIRNPLNSVSMGLQRLKGEFRPTQDEEEYSRFIELMRGEVQRLNSIVEEFLSLARPLEIKPEPVRIDELLKEMAVLVESDAKSKKVEIKVVVPPELPAAWVDRNYFKQALLNLILNGMQSMPHGGLLTLEAKVAHGKMVVIVADTGDGIPKDILPRIFEPYFTTKTKGAGLGLSIARRIVEAHGGTLTVDSAVGQGTRFQLAVPMSRQN
ncbi:MAG: two-component system sensor histidine kinase ZraS [Deltaproteobacteria bacterium]|jgi:signal transduction histidine kinase|nr:two-component system sensor histidine kinase ZraS [Deltaproteobacteria bacterium]